MKRTNFFLLLAILIIAPGALLKTVGFFFPAIFFKPPHFTPQCHSACEHSAAMCDYACTKDDLRFQTPKP
jgi:hypothetical protein